MLRLHAPVEPIRIVKNLDANLHGGDRVAGESLKSDG